MAQYQVTVYCYDPIIEATTLDGECTPQAACGDPSQRGPNLNANSGLAKFTYYSWDGFGKCNSREDVSSCNSCPIAGKSLVPCVAVGIM